MQREGEIEPEARPRAITRLTVFVTAWFATICVGWLNPIIFVDATALDDNSELATRIAIVSSVLYVFIHFSIFLSIAAAVQGAFFYPPAPLSIQPVVSARFEWGTLFIGSIFVAQYLNTYSFCAFMTFYCPSIDWRFSAQHVVWLLLPCLFYAIYVCLQRKLARFLSRLRRSGRCAARDHHGDE